MKKMEGKNKKQNEIKYRNKKQKIFLNTIILINHKRETHLACLSVTVLLTYITHNSIQAGFASRQTFRSSNVIFLFVFECVTVFMNYKVSGVEI